MSAGARLLSLRRRCRLYTGDAALRIDSLIPAAEAVAALTCEISRP